MPRPGTALAAVRLELADVNPYRYAGVAGIAMRAVGEHATAAKASVDQFRVGAGVDQMAGRGHFRPRLLTR